MLKSPSDTSLAVHRREDAIQEVCCLGWKWFKRLVERGKDVPGEILIAVVAELTRYGFWHDEGPFGEPGVPCQILIALVVSCQILSALLHRY